MTGTSHILLGTAVGVTAAITWCGGLYNNMDGTCVAVGCMIGSLFPDLDSKTSKVSYRLPVVSFFLRLFVGHRGVLHTPFVFVLFGILFSISHCLFFIPVPFIMGFLIGYLCHLLQDGVTKRGIRWLYPFSMEYFPIIGIKYGNMLMELLLSFAIYGLVGGLLGFGSFVFFKIPIIF